MNIIDASKTGNLAIGYQGEAERTEVQFHEKAVLEEFPGGGFTLLVRRPGESTVYPVSNLVTDYDTGIVSWAVEGTWLANEGYDGEAQLIYGSGDVVAKKKIYSLSVGRSITTDQVEPPTWSDWVTTIVTAAGDAQGAKVDAEAAQAAAEAAQTAAETAQTAAETAQGKAEDAQEAAEAAQGAAETAQAGAEAAQTAAETAQGKAEDAQDAAEAAQTAAETAQSEAEAAETGAEAAQEAAEAAQSAAETAQGKAEDAQDAAEAAQAGAEAAAEEAVAAAIDALIDDTSTASDKVWSAQKSNTLYEKPSGGIPETDLATALKNKIDGKANKTNPVFTGKMSLGRKTSTTEGSSSIALGSNVEASGSNSFAEGFNTKAVGMYQHASGYKNVADSMDNIETFVANKQYHKGDIVKVSQSSPAYIFWRDYSGTNINLNYCTQMTQGVMKYASIVGNGFHTESNAYTLDWGGNAEFAGDVKANACGGSDPVSLVETAASAAGKYTKPQTGIPKSDLASGVKTSLEKADTAYQKPGGGIPASDIAEGVIPDPEDLIDDTSTAADKVWSAQKVSGEVSQLSSALNAKYEKPSTGIPASDLASGVIPSVPVQDVQVNGTSVLSQGVANVPVGDYSTYGVIKVQQYGGLQFGSTNMLKTDPASESSIKTGTEGSRPLIPSRQHAAAFFGLAKAAGADMASVSGAVVGTYPEAQKVAIQKMLGIYQAPWELIREDTVTNETEADIEITVDGNGNSFELTDLRIVIISPVQQTQFKKADGRVSAYYSQNDYDSVYIGSYTQNANDYAKNSFAIFEQNNGMVTKYYMRNTTLGDNGALYAYSQTTGMFFLDNRVYTKVLITKVTGKLTYKLFGRRKWT